MLRAGSRWITVAIAVCVIGVEGCGGGHDTVPNTKMDYEGTVTDASTGQPIAGANVGVYTCEFVFCTTHATGTTDAQGHYTVFGECYSNNGISAWAEGYVASGHEANCAQGRQTADFALSPNP